VKPILDLSQEDRLLVWLTYADVADYLRYKGTHLVREARRWVQTHEIRRYYRSAHCVLVKRADVDAVLTGDE
jgi:spermidine synthase